mgnify:CR=1 FL=1
MARRFRETLPWPLTKQKRLEKVLAEGWEDTGMTLTGKQTWTIRSTEIPGYCSSCSRGINVRRWQATLALAAPLLFCFFLGGGGTVSSGYVLIGLFYGFYVLKKSAMPGAIGFCTEWNSN